MTLLTGVTMIYLGIMVEPSLFFQDLWQQSHCWLPKEIQEFESLLEVQIHFCIYLSLLSKIGQSPPQLQYLHSNSSRHNSRFFKLFAPSLLENPVKTPLHSAGGHDNQWALKLKSLPDFKQILISPSQQSSFVEELLLGEEPYSTSALPAGLKQIPTNLT